MTVPQFTERYLNKLTAVDFIAFVPTVVHTITTF